jgi:hypothetical protein
MCDADIPWLLAFSYDSKKDEKIKFMQTEGQG